MASLKERVTARVGALRERYGWLDHALRMVGHYGTVNGNAQAGAVTYFGFLSVFPILALAFFAVGQVARVAPDARGPLERQIDDLLPGVLGSGKGQIPLETVQNAATTVGVIGLVTLLYAGLGWLSGMRAAIEVMFGVPRAEQPNLVIGKLRDLGTLAVIGVTLVLSVGLSSAVTGFSDAILDAVHVDSASLVPSTLLVVLGHALGIAASTALLLTMFRLLVPESGVPRRSLLGGAVLGAVGFEVLKLAANLLLKQTQGSPAFQAFGVALIVVVWINYFSRLVMYAAAWAYTSPLALERRTAEATRAPGAALARGSAEVLADVPDRRRAPGTDTEDDGGTREEGGSRLPAIGAAALAGLGVGVAAGRRRRTGRHDS